MRTTLLATAGIVLFAAPAYAGQTEIAFETIVTLDKFRITNQSTIASLHRIYLRPSAEFMLTASHTDDMFLGNTPPWPGDDRVDWFVSRWHPGRWIEFSGTFDPASTLDVEFVEPTPKQERGYIFAPLESGTFRGLTVPEPGTWLLAIGAVAVRCGVEAAGLVSTDTR